MRTPDRRAAFPAPPPDLPASAVVLSVVRLRRSGECTVTLADGTTVQLIAEAVLSAGVHPGRMFIESELRTLLATDLQARARATALRMLARHPRTRRDLADRLLQRGFAGPAVESVVHRLAEVGLVNDAQYAERYVESRAARPRGRRLLARELRLRGVDAELADEATALADDSAAAEAAARSRLVHLQNVDRDVFFRRLGSFLQRRGFAYDTARAVIERLWHEVRIEKP